MGAAATALKMTADEYLAFEAASPTKHEFVRGELFAMSGTTKAHNRLVFNLVTAFTTALRARPCGVHFQDVKLRVEAANAYFYPDVIVTCDPRDRADPLLVRSPTVLVDVLSERTAEYDLGEKFDDYRRLESLREYVVVDSRRQRVVVYRRAEAGAWSIEPVPAGGTLRLPSLGLELPFAALYDDTDVPERAPRPAQAE